MIRLFLRNLRYRFTERRAYLTPLYITLTKCNRSVTHGH